MLRATVIGSILALVGATAAWSAPPALSDLTAANRQRLDQIAREFPTDDAAEQVAKFTDNPTAWLIGQASLTAGEEAAAAKKAHDLLLKNSKTVPTPPDVDQVFQQLIKALPSTFKPAECKFSVIVLDVPDVTAFSFGAGYVYVSKPLVEAQLTNKERGRNALAFVLAHELGHGARQHCRKGYQHLLIQDEIKNGLIVGFKDEMLKEICKTNLAPAGELAKFVYTSFQEDEADLFAWQLCRNAGLDLDPCLDFLRWAATVENTRALTDPQFKIDPKADRKGLPFYFASHPPALRRLKRLDMERNGGVDDPVTHGLFLVDRATGKLKPAAAGAVGQGEAALVLVHGLHGNENGFAPFITAASERADLKKTPLLFFRYPNNQSLARAGELLAREMTRVVASPEKATFVGHSAGGLVVRYAVEKKQMPLARAVLVAVPNQGSSLTRLKVLLDAGTFWDRIFMTDVLEAARVTLSEGVGEMGFDLEPDSLFLNNLGAEPKQADRYVVVLGNVRSKASFLPLDSIAALSTGLKLSRPSLKKQLTGTMQSEVLKHLTGEVIDQLEVPPEILRGDLVVSVYSAKIKGAMKTVETDLDHIAIIRDKGNVEKILDLILKP